jgi:hypothetical protein
MRTGFVLGSLLCLGSQRGEDPATEAGSSVAS